MGTVALTGVTVVGVMVFLPGRRYGVPTRWPEGTATNQTAQGEPHAASGAVFLQCLDGVCTARGGESTGGGAAFGCPLIPPDQTDQPLIRLMSVRRSNCSSMNDRAAAAGVAPNRYIPAGSEPFEGSDNRLRSLRRMVLRTTAGPNDLPRANATCGGVAGRDGASRPAGGSGDSSRYVHHSTPARARVPSAESREKSRRARSRQIKPTDGAGPWHGGPSARHDQRGCSCGHGSHASWHDDDCWVGRCASRSSPRPT